MMNQGRTFTKAAGAFMLLALAGCDTVDEESELGDSYEFRESQCPRQLHVLDTGCVDDPDSGVLDLGTGGCDLQSGVHAIRANDVLMFHDEGTGIYRVTEVDGHTVRYEPSKIGALADVLDNDEDTPDGEAALDDELDYDSGDSIAESAKPGADVKIDVGLDFKPSFDYDFGFGDRGPFGFRTLNSFEFLTTGTLKAHAKITVESSLDGGTAGTPVNDEHELYSKTYSHTAWLGYIPFHVSTDFKVSGFYDATIFGQPGITTGLQLDGEAHFGPKFSGSSSNDESSWQLDKGAALTPTFLSPTASGEGRVEGKVGLRFQLDTTLWRTFKVGVTAEPYVEVKAGTAPGNSNDLTEEHTKHITARVTCDFKVFNCGNGYTYTYDIP